MRRIQAPERPLSLPHHHLDRARREWLTDLARRQAKDPTVTNTLSLASGEWKCGEYGASLRHFAMARNMSPQSADAHVSLVNAAAMLGLRHVEDEALRTGLSIHPLEPRLRLHAARRRIPENWALARGCLQPVLRDPNCALFDMAIALVEAGSVPASTSGEGRHAAWIDGLRWVMAHSTDHAVHAGLPTDVLSRALQAAPVEGLVLECGVYFGRSIRLIAERVPGAQVHGFDSFQGLPEAWSAAEGAGAYSTGGRLPAVPENVTLHAGWFEDTLPTYFASHDGPIRLLHIDCDIYSSTRTVLAAATPRLVSGSVLVFDDFLGYPGYEQHELRAFNEWVRANHMGWELLAATFLGREVALRITHT